MKGFWLDWGKWKLKPKNDWKEKAKKIAALEAVKHVKDGFVVGLGSGSTAAYAIAEIGRKIREEEIEVLGIPTSSQAFLLAIKNKIPLTTLTEHPVIDLTIDGADQVDSKLNLIKGMGGALTREKIVASCSKKVIIIIDETKLTEKLGGKQPIPIEVLPFALEPVSIKIQKLNGTPKLREGKGKIGPVVTDNGNYISPNVRTITVLITDPETHIDFTARVNDKVGGGVAWDNGAYGLGAILDDVASSSSGDKGNVKESILIYPDQCTLHLFLATSS